MSLVAGTVAMTAVVTRAAEPTAGGIAAGADRQHEADPGGRPTSTTKTTATTTTTSLTVTTTPLVTTTSGSSAPGAVSLLTIDPVDQRFKVGPLKVNGQVYDMVASCYGYGKDEQEYHLDRKYTKLRVRLGLSDESDTEAVVKFSFRADQEIRRVESVPLGETRVVDVDITGALRIALVSENDSYRTVRAAWIDPVIAP
ncbi:NPCBM/NEW2 domain-containing protein [Actinokineospora sp. NBRC 105648]|uniref:NPCBM/NEW2 domain-containing protein n=1 Tax=Actinokineospora sp. NBRC 105648 TaxID=3032206 RepID=UPI00249FB849|nr:NPCBM/NEW2 domain-containing protein [Actinokineospora sp. NBRC 105648]GLZ39724.1 hypothetical protein Acsp05_33480 [Actinokineospora sp. NBRC 105648]